MRVKYAVHLAPRVGSWLSAGQCSAPSEVSLLGRGHGQSPPRGMRRTLASLVTSAAGGGRCPHTRPHVHRWLRVKASQGSDNRREKGAGERDVRKPFARAGLLKANVQAHACAWARSPSDETQKAGKGGEPFFGDTGTEMHRHPRARCPAGEGWGRGGI